MRFGKQVAIKYLFTISLKLQYFFPYHGSNEVAKGIEKSLLKQAGLK